VKRIVRELGVDKKTVKRWRHVGGWRAQRRRRRQQLEPFREFITRRGPEVCNAAVLHRELVTLDLEVAAAEAETSSGTP